MNRPAMSFTYQPHLIGMNNLKLQGIMIMMAVTIRIIRIDTKEELIISIDWFNKMEQLHILDQEAKKMSISVPLLPLFSWQIGLLSWAESLHRLF